MRDRVGGLDVMLVGDGDLPVVLLHGLGAPGDDLVPIAEVLSATSRRGRFVLPAAPLSLGAPYGYGRAWWHVDLDRLERALLDGAAAGTRRSPAGPGAAADPPLYETPAGMAEARAWIDHLLDEVAARWGAPPVLGGFSQGAMLSVDVAARSERPLSALVLLSGTLLCRDEWAQGLARRPGLPVFLSHGSGDRLLAFDRAEALRLLLAEAALQVEWFPFAGGHEIPPPVLHRLAGFLARVVP